MAKQTSNELIIDHLKALDEKLDKVRTEDIPNIKLDIKELKVRASIWGGITGIVGGFLAFLIPTR